MLQQLLLLLLARDGRGKRKFGWARTLLTNTHTPHISNTALLQSRSNAKDVLGLKKKINHRASKVRGEQKPLTQQQYIRFRTVLQWRSLGTQRPWGMPFPCMDICTRCLGHWVSNITEKQPFVSFQLSSLERLPAALFWTSLLTNKLSVLPREAHSPGKLMRANSVGRKE